MHTVSLLYMAQSDRMSTSTVRLIEYQCLDVSKHTFHLILQGIYNRNLYISHTAHVYASDMFS